MRPCGPVPLTCARSMPCAAATRAATGVTLIPSGVRMVSASPAGRTSVGSGLGATAGLAPLPLVILAMTWPTVTVSPAWARSSVIVPVAGAGTSASTLSVEISTSVSSSATGSPSCLCHSRMVPSETDSPIAGMTTSTVVLTAMSCLDHTALQAGFLPALTALLHDESDAAREGPDRAHHGDHHAEPERDDPGPHGVDAQQRDDDPADSVRPPEGLPRLVGRPQHEQGEVHRRVGEGQVLEAGEGDHASSRVAMWRSAGCASCGHAPTSRGHHAKASCSGSGVTSAPGAIHACPTSIHIWLGMSTSASTLRRSAST